MGLNNMNPMANIYKDFIKILQTMTIKYSYLAEENETFETKKLADGWIEAKQKKDNFYTYRDYSKQELDAVGIIDYKIISKVLQGEIDSVPEDKREALLLLRRQRVLDRFEEQNEYYRMLNGYPPIKTKPNKMHYVPKEIAKAYNIEKSVPIHKLQDYYNKIKDGEGDRIINLIDGLGIIKNLKKTHPDETYLNYLGSNRIDLIKARRAKNFEILSLDKVNIKSNVFDAFTDMYGKCRDYFVNTVFVNTFRSFFDYYDNFIAMCIMVMTMQQLIMKQIPFEVERNFFDVYAVQMLYDAYNIPYDLDIDEETQNNIVRNLNLIIQNKATDKVIYDIGKILGFNNLKVYKYFLGKEHRYDIYGVPIFKYKEQFNNDTGEVETVPDYEAMYDIYFEKEELKNNDFIQTFNSKINRVEYEDVTTGDPFWWEDQNLYHRKWDVDYNFVETKYLSLGLSYSMTDIIFENIILLKLLISQESKISDITLSVPKILDGVNVPIFDLVILLICLVAKKHNLTGEIISIPTQVINVLDYLQNTEGGEEYLVDTFSFNFDYLLSEEGIKETNKLKDMLGEEDAKLFTSYISVLSIDSNADPSTKIKTLNLMYENIKKLNAFLQLKMTACADKEMYYCIKTLQRAIFYSKEVKSVFTITGKTTGFKRTAFNYFEYLHFKNPKLYSAIFKFNEEDAYKEYCEVYPDKNITYEEFLSRLEKGLIQVSYDNLRIDEMSGNAKISEETIYYYINHIISRFKTIINKINFLYMENDAAVPLQELLVKLVKFAKSFTVDMLDLDIIYICDMKDQNMIRLIDVPWYINKLIAPNDRINLSHSDIVKKIIAQYELEDKINLKDLAAYNKELFIGTDSNNHVIKDDKLHYMVKDIQLEEEKAIQMYDTYNLQSTILLKDKHKPMLKDKVKVWYSE
mgnify:CR=1 FL=1